METKTLAEQFNKFGYELWEVGGSVRDSILGRTPNDYDFATNALPNDTKRILDEMGGSVFTVGQKWGTIRTILPDGTEVDVTTYRGEDYPDRESRNPEVLFGTSLKEDLARRDFTIGAIARNPLTGEVYDPFNGLEDISGKVIRCVGSDIKRFDADPLRMMRAIRLSCQTGFRLNVKMLNPERLAIIHQERVRDELTKILLSPKAAAGISMLVKYGLMKYIAPEFLALLNLRQGKNHIKDAYAHSLLVLKKGTMLDHGDDNLVFRLACWLHDIGKPECFLEDEEGVHFYRHQYVGSGKAERILRRLRFESETIERVCSLIEYHMDPLMLEKAQVAVNGSGKSVWMKAVRHLIRKVGERDIYLLLDLNKCDVRSSKNHRGAFIRTLIKTVEEAMREKPASITSPLSGDELMSQFGLQEGIKVGQLKSYLTNLVVDGELDQNDKESAVRRAKEWLILTESSLTSSKSS